VIELHCVQADPTLDAVRGNPHVTFFVSDYLAWSPHTGSMNGMPDAQPCTSEQWRSSAMRKRISTDPEDVAGALQRLLRSYEPGATYEPSPGGRVLRPSIAPARHDAAPNHPQHIKFKTGPAGTAETKQKVADRLRESGGQATCGRPRSSRPLSRIGSGREGEAIGPWGRLKGGR